MWKIGNSLKKKSYKISEFCGKLQLYKDAYNIRNVQIFLFNFEFKQMTRIQDWKRECFERSYESRRLPSVLYWMMDKSPRSLVFSHNLLLFSRSRITRLVYFFSNFNFDKIPSIIVALVLFKCPNHCSPFATNTTKKKFLVPTALKI